MQQQRDPLDDVPGGRDSAHVKHGNDVELSMKADRSCAQEVALLLVLAIEFAIIPLQLRRGCSFYHVLRP
jgi:hypothetical protein